MLLYLVKKVANITVSSINLYSELVPTFDHTTQKGRLKVDWFTTFIFWKKNKKQNAPTSPYLLHIAIGIKWL